MPAKLTQEVADQRVQQKCKELNYTCSSFEYIGKSKTYLPLKCHCSHKWNSTTYSNFINQNSGCPKCGGTAKLTQEEAVLNVQQKCKELNYTCSSFEYIGAGKTYLPLKCHCSHKWNSTTYNNFINKNDGCPKCGGTAKITQEVADQRVQQKCKELNYTCSSFEYIGNSKTYLPLKCHCSHKWNSTTYDNFINKNSGCPKCGAGEAKCIAQDIDPILGDDIYREKRFDDCRDKRHLPFDRYIPYLNMLLEYDGEQHFNGWGNSKYDKLDIQYRDNIKTEYAINNGYNFIRIAYYEDHVKALESFLALVLKHQDKQIVQIYGEVQILDKN